MTERFLIASPYKIHRYGDCAVAGAVETMIANPAPDLFYVAVPYEMNWMWA